MGVWKTIGASISYPSKLHPALKCLDRQRRVKLIGSEISGADDDDDDDILGTPGVAPEIG